MKAVIVQAGYGLQNTELQDARAPALGECGIRIQVRSAGVSFANLLAIDGKHQNRAEPPFIPGTEVAGVVLECGPGASLFKPGDRVVAGVRKGGFAQEVVAPEHNVFALPDAVSYDAAVHFPTIYATAYAAFKWRAHLAEGETLLVHGAAGGSGLAAIELGKAMGARVIASASSAEKLRVAAEHGADVCVDYSIDGFRDVVLADTGGRGADVIFDPVGGKTFDESLRCIAPEGRIVPMGFASGVIPSVPANIALVKNITVIGLYWGYYMGWGRQLPPDTMQAKVRSAFEEMLAWTSAGRLKPRTQRAYPLADFREALQALSDRSVIGRSVLNP
ncbi:NADPH:quinone oxidoreductase family protein [Bordetella genomosp. 13]|uniref:NADPH:quinone oxidoreductase family protein n=1 Tax=Bordetella genomosp. 13 TaxID=463040 RepID=UPI0011A514E6|nr:NADPH:quinone oxidoreductase family protein [Bordetella genomosp. 13]